MIAAVMTKPLLQIFLIGLTFAAVANPISFDDFKRIKSESERAKIISAAPENQKDALRKISLHLSFIDRYGGEEHYNLARERTAAANRGLLDIERLFLEYPQIVA